MSAMDTGSNDLKNETPAPQAPKLEAASALFATAASAVPSVMNPVFTPTGTKRVRDADVPNKPLAPQGSGMVPASATPVPQAQSETTASGAEKVVVSPPAKKAKVESKDSTETTVVAATSPTVVSTNKDTVATPAANLLAQAAANVKGEEHNQATFPSLEGNVGDLQDPAAILSSVDPTTSTVQNVEIEDDMMDTETAETANNTAPSGASPLNKDTRSRAAPVPSPSPSPTRSLGRQTRSRVVRSADSDDPSALTLYVPGGSFPSLDFLTHRLIEVRVSASHISTKNYEVQTRKVWGTDVYTDDSDLVAMLLHSNKFPVRAPPPRSIAGVAVILRVLPGGTEYKSTTNNGVRSRRWESQYDRCGLKIVRTSTIVSGDSEMLNLRARRGRDSKDSKVNPTRAKVLNMAPPDKAYSKYSNKSRTKHMSEAVFCFTPENDVACRSVLAEIRDRGMSPTEWTMNRFKNEVLYFGTKDGEYELAREEGKGKTYSYRLSKVVNVEPSEASGGDAAPASKRKLRGGRQHAASELVRCVPLLKASTELVAEGVEWDEIEWQPDAVSLRGSTLQPTYVKFRPIKTF